MNQSERELLMPFLRKLVNSRTMPADVAANNLIKEAVRSQPNANYLLVQRALSLEHELAAAQRRIMELEGKPPPQEATPFVADFLNPETARWGEPGNGKAGPTTSKILYDLFIQPGSQKPRDMESRIVFFVGRYSGRIWLILLAIIAAVVLVKERLV